MSNNQLARELSLRETCIEKLPIWYGSRENYLHGFKEIMSNAIDEISNNFKNGEIVVRLDNDYQTISISDTGRGIPLFIKNAEGKENYIMLFKTLFAGTKYDVSANDTGTNGVGTCVLNHTSELFKVESYHDNGYEMVEFNKGELVNKARKKIQHQHGTTVTWKLDNDVYPVITYELDELKSIILNFAGVSNKIKFVFYVGGELVDEYSYGDLSVFADTVIKDKTCKPLKSPNMTYTLSNTLKDGVNELVHVEGFITTSVTPIQKTYLNRTYLSEGGTVVDGVIDGILEVCNDYCITYKKFPKGVKEFTKKDVIDSFSFVVTVLSNNVEFTNQTKLSTRKKEYRKYVKEYVKALMLAEISERPKNFDKIIKHLLTVNKANENNDKARAKLNRELTKAITGIGKRPDKLVDCSPKYIGAGKGGEVHICEGDSALGTVIQARHKDNFQAGFPIRGKILNVLKKPLKEVMNNELIKQIFQIIGTGILEDFDIEKRRYDRIILDCDNDTDGFQIRQLVISVLWLLAPQLIKEGMVYICQTPLYEVRCEKNKMLYIYNESEKDKVLSTIEGKYKLSRAKGLGELDAHTMFHCAMNPETRQMIKVTVHDVQEYQQALELWMADEVAPRRDYIMNNLQKYLDGEITLVDKNNAQQLLNHDYMEYSGYCICDRAIVNLYDGLKPVHLRILWTMYNGKMFDFTKCRNVSGATMMYHPHGSAYISMVNMIQGDGNNVPFIIGKGSFGMHTSKNLKPADDRYTECHLSDFGRSLFKNLDQINMVDNYDGKLKIPEVAPVDFPNALCVGTQGIAVGIGAFIPSFNLKEVCQATIDYLQGKEIPLLYPDFPTKGVILPDNKNLLDCNMTGQGRFVIRGNIYAKDKTTLIIDEIPYTTTIEDIISAIENLANKGVHEIKDVVNNTNLEGMSIEITVKANSDKDYLINLIYNNTPLQTTFKSNIGVLYKNKPIYIGVHEVIRKWCEWKQECVKTSLSKKINKTMKDGHLLSAYEKIVDDLDRALDIIRKGEDVITELKNVYGLDEQQAEYIYQSPIGNFNHKKVEKLIAKLNALRKEYKELVETYNSDVAIKQIVIDGLQNTIDKFAIPRNTKIEDFNIEKTEIKVAQKDIPVNSIIVTKEGYVYKTSPKNKDNILLKPSDEVVLSQDGVKDNAELLLFNKKDCNKVPISSIEYTKNNTLGTLTQSNCIATLLTENTKYILYVYKEGRVCLVNADSFRTKTQRKKLGNSVCERLTLINVIALEEHQKFTLMGTKGKIKEIDTSEITEKTKRDSQGIRVTKREIVNII